MKKRTRILYLTGILLTCQLSLAACQTNAKNSSSQEPKKEQKQAKKI
ncbi:MULTISPECIES: hypothetical protein [unclassified Streptococcus]|nr:MULTISPECIES: hypothetical protein [unclassified Streptococcus]